MRASLPPVGARAPWILGALALALALVHVLVFALRWSGGAVPAWGWDESMHAALPGARVALHAVGGAGLEALRAVHECERYPPVMALVLAVPGAAWAALRGAGDVPFELLDRATLMLAWLLLGVGGLAALGREVGRVTGRALAGPLAALFALLSPLAARYAPTLFLEPLFVAFMIQTLRSWCALRRPAAPPRAGLAAGLWLTLAVFTKWNYGLLLVGALGASALVEAALAALLGGGRAAALTRLRREGAAALPLVVVLGWWFVLPLPFGGDVAAVHRAQVLDYLTSNTQLQGAPGFDRAFFWYCGVAAHPALLALLALGALRSLARLDVPAVRTLWVSGLVLGVPIVTHGFFLDRFLLAPGAVLFALAGVGGAEALGGGRAQRALTVMVAAVLAGLSLGTPIFDWAGRLGFPTSAAPDVAAYQRRIIREVRGLAGIPASNGLDHASHEALLDLVAAGVGPDERVGWVGQSSEVSPAALHFGLLARGGDTARFLRDAHRPMDLAPVPRPVEEALTSEEVRAWAEAFGALILTEPVDLRGRAARDWVRDAWQRPLLEGAWRAAPLGELLVPRDPGEPLRIEVQLARRE